MFCMTCSDGLDLAMGACASDVGCDAGVGRIYTWLSEGATGSGLFWGLAVALGFNFMGIS